MPIPSLSDEQIRTWTRGQKDRWWLETVYRGNMPQLTVRAAVTGFFLGGLLSATNLYIGAKTGWTLGVGLTSVILAFAMFRTLSRFGVHDMTILENNAMQSVATAAGYMTGPMVSGFTAYMWIQNETIPLAHFLIFNVVLSVMGVLVAFPMKRRFINDEQQPFPEGRACGVVLDTLYTASAALGMFKARLLTMAAGVAGFITFVSGENFMRLIQEKWFGLKKTWSLPTNLDAWYYALVEKAGWPIPRIANVDIRQLALSPSLDLAMFGAGALMGLRTAGSMTVGMILNFVVIVPSMIATGHLAPRQGSVEDGTALFGRAHILTHWSLWWGITIMMVASLVSLFAKPQIYMEAFRSFRGRGTRKTSEADPLKDIEFPLWISWAGVPLIGVVAVWMAHAWFGVHWLFGILSIPLTLLLSLIAASSTALTGITPTGALSKIPQFLFGAMDPKHPPTNLMTGVMSVEVATNASNLLMDIKPGYMLGGKPRQQALGHIIGIFSGALFATPLFFVLFLPHYQPGQNIQAVMSPDGGPFSFPGAVQWKGVSDLVTSIFGGSTETLLTPSIVTSMIVAGFAGVVLEVTRILTHGKFPLSPLAIGLGVVIPPDSTMAMFAGALFFTWMHHRYEKRPESTGHKLWVESAEPICAGLIAGSALIGIGDILVKVFVFG